MPERLAPNTRIGSFDVVALLGEGGMGQVYRARDTKLGRDVALKILPDDVVHDAARRARFDREARALATLNHVNIAQIYGLEDGGPTRAIVMELVEGEDLAARLARGALSVSSAVAIAVQIANALEAAHARQIVHRDLKPANVKIRGDGTVKLLDFGIAKVFEEARPDDRTVGPGGATEAGRIVGTLRYMSPEQALGQPVDKRTDIWAFGCVLYEMLTGVPAFGGAASQATVAAMLEGDVDWTRLPRHTPAGVQRVLRRCLTRAHNHRLADIADARLDLEDVDPLEDRPVAGRFAAPRWLGFAGAAVTGALIAGGALAGWPRPAQAPRAVARLSVLPPPGERLSSGVRAVALSPDGGRLAIVTERGLYVRALDGLERRRISDWEEGVGNVAFSPDGSRIAVMGLNGIQLIDTATGTTTTVPVPTVNQAGILGSLSWSNRGLVGAFGGGGVWLMQRDEWEPLIRLEAGEATSSAELLPDGGHVLMTVLKPPLPLRSSEVVIQDIAAGTRTLVAERASDAVLFAGSHTSYVLYVRDGVLLAHPFDTKSLEATGEPVRVVAGVQAANFVNATMQYAVASTGTLAYVPGQAMPAARAMDLAIVDRRGEVAPLHLPPAPYETPRVSPDGQLLAVGTDDGAEASIWVRDLAGRSSIRRLTLAARNRFPVWSADGTRIAFQSDQQEDLAIFSQAADGSDAPVRLTTPEAGSSQIPESWSRSHLLYSVVQGDAVTLWALSLADRRASPVPGVTSTTPIAAVFSPDGRWIAYNTAPVSGIHTTYVRPFPPTDEVHEISRDDDGHHPVWSRDGHELIYIPGPRRLAAVRVQFTPSFSFSPPDTLPPVGLMGPGTRPRNFDILPDGDRFIGLEIAEDDERRAGGAERIDVVTDLQELIAQGR